MTLRCDASALRGIYVPVQEPKKYGGRIIEKYLCDTRVREEPFFAAAKAVIKLLKDNRHLHPTFEIEPRSALAEKIKNNNYLTINGDAVSLAEEKIGDGAAPREFKDRFFSQTLIQSPVRCPEGHIFERERAEIWARHTDNTCPAGEHPIGDLEVDEELELEIQDYRESKGEEHRERQQLLDENIALAERVKQQETKIKAQEEAKAKLERHQQLLALKNVHLEQNQNGQRQEIDFLRGIKNIDPWMMGSALGKVIIKAGGKSLIVSLAKLLATTGTKEVAKATGKAVAKYIPFLSLFIGIGLAVYRATQGQYGRMFAEFASGCAACIPVYGTAISVSFDVSIALYDMYEGYTSNKAGFTPVLEMDLKQAYHNLEIDFEEQDDPTKEQVDSKYKLLARRFHWDKTSEYEEHYRGKMEESLKIINFSRDEIYRQRGWGRNASERGPDEAQSLLIIEMSPMESSCSEGEEKDASS